MAVKEEVEVKAEQNDEKDELAALDALEKEATEFNKVECPFKYGIGCLLIYPTGCRDRSNTQSLQARCVRSPLLFTLPSSMYSPIFPGQLRCP